LYCACIAAVLSKESGLMVAPLLVLFDLMLGGGTAWRRRTALHLALLPVWLLYLWWRTHLGMMPAVADLTAGLDWSGWPSLQLERLSRLVAPGATAPAVTVGLFTAFVAVTAGKTRGVRRWIVFAAVWVAMTFAPTSWQPVFPNLLNGRSLVLTSLGLALAAGVVNAAAAPRWWARVGRIALVVAAIAMGACVRTLQDDYARQWQRMRALREQVAATAPRVRTEAPLVLLSLHLGHDFRLPFLDVERAYPLAATPLVPAPIPFVSLGSVLDLSAGPMMMAGDVTAWRVMWQHGATLAYWRLGDHGSGELVTIDGPGASTPSFSPDANGFVPDRGPASPWSIGSLEVAAGAAFSGGRVGWQAKDGSIGEFALGPSRQSGAEHRQTIDVSTDASFVMFATLGGGIVRMTVALDGPAPPRATALVALPMPELAPLRRTLRGAPMALSECGDGLAWNSLPADAEPGSAAIVLMNRSFGFRVSRPTGRTRRVAARRPAATVAAGALSRYHDVLLPRVSRRRPDVALRGRLVRRPAPVTGAGPRWRCRRAHRSTRADCSGRSRSAAKGQCAASFTAARRGSRCASVNCGARMVTPTRDPVREYNRLMALRPRIGALLPLAAAMWIAAFAGPRACAQDAPARVPGSRVLEDGRLRARPADHCRPRADPVARSRQWLRRRRHGRFVAVQPREPRAIRGGRVPRHLGRRARAGRGSRVRELQHQRRRLRRHPLG
jgi:hypothetical protein